MNYKKNIFLILCILTTLLSISSIAAINFDYFDVDGLDNPGSPQWQKENGGYPTYDGLLDFMGVTPFSEVTVVTVDDIEFKIPKGFGEWEENTIDDEIDGDGYVLFSKNYVNEVGQFIFINVKYKKNPSERSNSLDMGDEYVKKTINGIKGYFDEDDGTCYFAYKENKKLVFIGSSSESLINFATSLR